MPFGLANTLLSFQYFIYNILNWILDKFCTAYIDNILIYSHSKKEYHTHI